MIHSFKIVNEFRASEFRSIHDDGDPGCSSSAPNSETWSGNFYFRFSMMFHGIKREANVGLELPGIYLFITLHGRLIKTT